MGIPMGVVENDWRWGAPGDGRESWSRMNEEQRVVGEMSKGPILQVPRGCDAEGGLCTNCSGEALSDFQQVSDLPRSTSLSSQCPPCE